MPEPDKSSALPRWAKGLAEAGLALIDVGKKPKKNKNHILKHDQSVFSKKLRQTFISEPSFPDNVKRMVEGFTEHLENNPQALLTALDSTETDPDCTHARGRVQDSVVRILLQMEDVQPRLLPWLMDKLGFIGLDEDGETAESRGKKTQLILSQMCWLDNIVEGDALVEKIIEVMTCMPEAVAREIVLRLPEVVDTPNHSKLAMPLVQMMKSHPDLTNYVLEAFTALDIHPDVLAEVRSDVHKRLALIPMADVPVVVKFLLDATQTGEEEEVFRQIREELDITAERTLTTSTQQRNGHGAGGRSKGKEKDVDTLTLNIMRSSMASSKKASAAWYHVVEVLKRRDDHRPLDLMILLLLHELPHRRKVVESLLRSKIRGGLLAKELVSKTFRSHADALRKNFDGILSIAEQLGLIRGEPSLNEFALVLYQECFLHFDAFCQQDLIYDLTMKANGGADGPIGLETSIKTLSHLAFNFTEQASKFSLMLVTVLDHVDSLELSQVRSLYDLLSYLAYYGRDSPETTSLKDGLHIVVKKQIVAHGPAIRKMGAVGAVMAVKNMNSTIESESSSSQSSDLFPDDGPTSAASSARKMLERVWTKSKGATAEAGPGVFMDELSAVIGKGKLSNKGLVKWIEREIASGFKDEFLVESGAGGHKGDDRSKSFLPMSALYGMDDDGMETDSESSQDFVLNLCPLVVHSVGAVNDSPPALKIRASRLLSHFRLLVACVAAWTPTDLDPIEELLRCPILAPTEDVVLKCDSLSNREKNVACATLFYCANWFRELLNAFASAAAEEPARQRLVLNRLKDLISVQSAIASCVSAHPTFTPPPVLHLADCSAWQPPSCLTEERRKGGGGGGGGAKRGRKRKVGNDDTIEQITQTTNTAAAAKKQAQSAAPLTVPMLLDHYAPFFRELDLSAFAILGYNTVAIESKPGTQEERRQPKLRPAELSFLLRDLLLKVERTLLSVKTKKAGKVGGLAKCGLKNAAFANLQQHHSAEEVARHVVDQFEYLLGNLDVVMDYFKNLVAANDGDLDDVANLFSSSTPDILDCLERILSLFNVVFGWSGFAGKDQDELLREALHLVGRRSNARLKQRDPINDLTEAALAHLGSISDAVVVIGCAEAQIRSALTVSQFSQESSDTLGALAEKYLKRSWQDAEGKKEKGAKFNAKIETLIRLHLARSAGTAAGHDSDSPREDDDDPEARWRTLKQYVTAEMKTVFEGNASAASEVYPTFNKCTFHLHYRLFLEHLGTEVKKVTFTRNSSASAHFGFWSEALEIFHDLVDVARMPKVLRPAELGHLLKHGRLFLDSLLKHGMQVLDRLFSSRSEDCINFLKTLQASTRQLQHVANHSKMKRDIAMARHVPTLKKSLEMLIYRVKAMLALNKQADAFWMGILKNRKLDGKVIQEEASDDEEDDNESATTTRSERSSAKGSDDERDGDGEGEEDSDVELNSDDDDDDNDNGIGNGADNDNASVTF